MRTALDELRVPKARPHRLFTRMERRADRLVHAGNLASTHRRITRTSARGVEFEGKPEAGVGTYAMFKDSEGNRFVISEYRT